MHRIQPKKQKNMERMRNVEIRKFLKGQELRENSEFVVFPEEDVHFRGEG